MVVSLVNCSSLMVKYCPTNLFLKPSSHMTIHLVLKWVTYDIRKENLIPNSTVTTQFYNTYPLPMFWEAKILPFLYAIYFHSSSSLPNPTPSYPTLFNCSLGFGHLTTLLQVINCPK